MTHLPKDRPADESAGTRKDSKLLKVIIGVAAAVLIAGGVFGFAAPLDVVANNFQHGNDGDVTCDDQVQVSWNYFWSNSGGGNGPNMYTGVVHVNGVSSACDGNAVVITLTDPVGNFLAQSTGPVILPASSFDFSSQWIPVSQVEDVHVTISNP